MGQVGWYEKCDDRMKINTGFFDYGIVSENEIIPVSNQATELPNLIHVFSCSTP